MLRRDFGRSFVMPIFSVSQSRPVHCISRAGASATRLRQRCGKIRKSMKRWRALSDCTWRPGSFSFMKTRKGSISLPYWTPEGQAVSQARQLRQRSRCRFTSSSRREVAVDHLPHEVDAAARRIALVGILDVGRATRGAQTAVDAIEDELVVDVRAGRQRLLSPLSAGGTMGRAVFAGVTVEDIAE